MNKWLKWWMSLKNSGASWGEDWEVDKMIWDEKLTWIIRNIVGKSVNLHSVISHLDWDSEVLLIWFQH
jgi:hypothetical protein